MLFKKKHKSGEEIAEQVSLVRKAISHFPKQQQIEKYEMSRLKAQRMHEALVFIPPATVLSQGKRNVR